MDGSERRDDPAIEAALLERLIEDRRNGNLAPLAHYEALFPGDEVVVRRVHSQFEHGGSEPVLPPAATVDVTDSKVGRFRIQSELGRGGQAIVYRAEDPTLRRTVALKILTVGAHLSENSLRRFRREAEIASRLDHPGICPVYDTGVDGGLTWIAMRCVEGETLARRIAAARQSPGREPITRAHALRVIAFMEKVARALHAAHEAGVVHRDVKPGNIMVLPDGEPVVLDFGLARAEDGATSHVTQTGDFLGTPSYMAPEQLAGPSELVDRRADVWGLGVTLYETLTLKRPFEDSTRGGLEDAIRSRDPSRVRRENSQIPRDLDAIVEKALEKNPRRRYATAAELADDLHRVLVHEPVKAKPAGALLKTQRWVQRNPVPALLIVVLVAGLATALVLLEKIKAREGETQAALRHTRALALAQTAEQTMSSTNPRLALRFALGALDLEPTLIEAISEVHHLVAFDHPALDFLHVGAIRSVEISPDGQEMLTASDDGKARVYDLSNGSVIRQFEGHRGALHEATWSATKDMALTCSEDGTARTYRGDGTELLCLHHPAAVQTARFTAADRILTGCDDGIARLWDVAGHVLVERKALESPIRALSSADGSRFLTYCATSGSRHSMDDASAQLWTSELDPAGDPLRQDGPILFATFSPSGDQVVTCSMDQTAVVWDRDGRRLHELKRHTGPVLYAAYSNDGRQLVTCSTDRTARVWNVRDGEMIHEFRHGGAVLTAAFSPDDQSILTASADQLVRVCSSDGFIQDFLCGRQGAEVLCTVSFLPGIGGAPRILTASRDGKIRISDAWPAELPILARHHGTATAATFSRDGSRVATGGQGVVCLWTRTGTLLRELHAGFGTVDALAFSGDGGHLAAGCYDGSLLIWNLDDPAEPARAHLDGPVFGVEFSSIDSLVMVACVERPVSFWTTRAEPVRSFTKGTPAVRAALSPDGRFVLTGHADGAARLWNLDGNLLQTFAGHRGSITSVAFHPSGKQVLTSGEDGRVVRWGLDARPLSVMHGPDLIVHWSVFSPGGDLIASAHGDGRARLWSLDGELIACLRGHGEPVFHVTFSPDGSRLATSSADGVCRFWFTRSEDLLRYARSLDLGPLGDDDRRHYAEMLGVSPSPQGSAITDPEDAATCASLAWSIVEPGAWCESMDSGRAVALAGRAMSIAKTPTPALLRTLGTALLRAGRLQEAVSRLEAADALRVTASTPRSAVDHAALSIARWRLGLTVEASASLKVAHALLLAAPNEPSGREAVAEAEEELKAERTASPPDPGRH